MPKISLTNIRKVAEPANKEISALHTLIQQYYNQNDLQQRVYNFVSWVLGWPVASITIDDIVTATKNLDPSIKKLSAVIKAEFTRKNISIDQTYSDEINRLNMGVLTQINVFATMLYKFSESAADKRDQVNYLNAAKLLFSRNIKIIGYITHDFFYDKKRRLKIGGFDNQTGLHYVSNTRTFSFTSGEYPKLLEDSLFSMARCYEALEQYQLAKYYFEQASDVLQELLSQSRKANPELVIRLRDIDGKLAEMNAKLGYTQAAKYYLDKYFEKQQTDKLLAYYSQGAIAAFVPVIQYCIKHKSFHYAYALIHKAQNVVAGFLRLNTNKSLVIDNSISTTLENLNHQCLQDYHDLMRSWCKANTPALKLELKNERCLISGFSEQAQRKLGQFAHKHKLDVIDSQLVIPNIFQLKTDATKQIFVALKKFTNQNKPRTQERPNKKTVYPEFIPPVSEPQHQQTKEQPIETPAPRTTPKIKTRGKAKSRVGEQVAQGKASGLQTTKVHYQALFSPPKSAKDLYRLSSRSVAKGPYAYLDLSLADGFFKGKQAKITDVLSRGKIVPRFGEQGIKACHKENKGYDYKIKFLGKSMGDVRVYGKIVGEVHEEDGSVPVIEFSHCVSKAHR